jgi:FkbM family methyltransferase
VSAARELIASNRYGRYCVPLSSKDRPAAARILAGQVWEPHTLAFMVAHCGDGDIIHAGAYFGDFIPALAKALGGGARLWAFEPSRENFRCAAQTIELNKLENVRLMHAALGERAQVLPLLTGTAQQPAMGGMARIVAGRSEGETHEDVRIVAIDDVVPRERRVSICQLDVERYEREALAGGLATIRKSLPILILETVPESGTWFADAILGLGYAARGKVHSNTVFSTRDVSLPRRRGD